jgi:uncharacterized protein (DUF4415 family)
MKNAKLSAFERDLLESVRQAENGAHAAVHTPDAIQARKRGRPVGSTKPDAKIPTTLRLPPDVLARWKATGPGWQTRMVQRLSAP